MESTREQLLARIAVLEAMLHKKNRTKGQRRRGATLQELRQERDRQVKHAKRQGAGPHPPLHQDRTDSTHSLSSATWARASKFQKARLTDGGLPGLGKKR
jgi:hypothetical protein